MKFQATYITRPINSLHNDEKKEIYIVYAIDKNHAINVLKTSFYKKNGCNREIIETSINVKKL
jgi:hypothetical protein